MRIRLFVASVLTLVLLTVSVVAQSKSTTPQLPQDFLGFKARYTGGTKKPAIKMRYDLRYRVMTEKNVRLLVMFISKLYEYPLINSVEPDEYGWDVEIRNNSKAALDQADTFVADFGLLVGKKGNIISLPDHADLYEPFFVGPKPKDLNGRQVTFTSQNGIGLRPRKGDQEKLQALLQEEGFRSEGAALVQNNFIFNKANAWTWDEILLRITKVLE